MSLTEYNKKRNFNVTSEPRGKPNKTNASRFVIQYHKARAKHYDFRLEHKGVLLSWAVPKGLSTNPKDKRLAVMVEDHPVDYIDFEGIIPKGNYGAGTVDIYDEGIYLPIKDFDEGLKKGQLKFVLNGDKLQGAWTLIRTDKNNWIILKIDDKYAKTVTKNTKLPFKKASVQLATLTNTIPRGKDWVFEIKYDGYRILAYNENGKVKLVSRNNNDYTTKFCNIATSISKLDVQNCVLDGEVVVFDDKGRSDFGLLQQSIKSGKKSYNYVIFDLLALNGDDLRDLPLEERKAKLQRLLYKANKNLIYSQHVSKGKESFEFAKNNQLEGVVAKKINSIYSGTRSEDWLKIKCYLRQEFVIAGYTTTDKNELLSALLLGYYDKTKLIYVGKVGTGFDDKDRKELHKLFKDYVRKTCPFENKLKVADVTWLQPKFVAEIQFAEFTKDGNLRQPSYIALRHDKIAKDVVLEVSGGTQNKNNKSR